MGGITLTLSIQGIIHSDGKINEVKSINNKFLTVTRGNYFTRFKSRKVNTTIDEEEQSGSEVLYDYAGSLITKIFKKDRNTLGQELVNDGYLKVGDFGFSLYYNRNFTDSGSFNIR